MTLYRRVIRPDVDAFFTKLNQVMLYDLVEELDGEPPPGPRVSRSPIAWTFEEGLALLDRSPEWVRLYPMTVAPAFASRLLTAVIDRLAQLELDDDDHRSAIARWRRVCDRAATTTHE